MLFGLIFFVPLLGLAIGAASGALFGSLADVGISDSFIKSVRDQVTPGTSALFLLSSDAVIDRVKEEFPSQRRRADQHQPLRRAGGQAPRRVRAGGLTRPGGRELSREGAPLAKEDQGARSGRGFAVLAAVSPTALLVYGGLPRVGAPEGTALMYVAGAVVMTVLMAVTVLLVLHATGLNQPRQRGPRYGLRLGPRRHRPGLHLPPGQAQAAPSPRARHGAQAARPGRPAHREPQPAHRLPARPAAVRPSATFIAAIQVIASANEGVPSPPRRCSS